MKKISILLLLFSLSLIKVNAQNDSLSTYYEEGLNALQNFQYQEALDLFFECQREDPKNITYLSKVGYCYFQLGNLPEARLYLQQVLKQDSLHVSSLNYLATIEGQMADYSSALSRVEELLVIDSVNSYYHRLGGALSEQLNKIEDAMIYYQEAIRLNPADQTSLIAFCQLLNQAGYLHHADSLLENALNKQPKNLKLLYESAKLNYRLRTYDQVLPRFKQSMELGDTNLAYLPLLPFSLAQMEQCEEAIYWMEYFIKKKEPNEQMHYFLGFCYHKMDSLERSIAHYEKAVEEGISPNLSVYYQHMGDIMAQKEKHRHALKNYEQAIKYGNQDPVVYFHMAVAFDHVYIKDKKRPFEYYKKYIAAYDAKNPEFKKYAEKRIAEIDYYEKHIWKGNN